MFLQKTDYIKKYIYISNNVTNSIMNSIQNLIKEGNITYVLLSSYFLFVNAIDLPDWIQTITSHDIIYNSINIDPFKQVSFPKI